MCTFKTSPLGPVISRVGPPDLDPRRIRTTDPSGIVTTWPGYVPLGAVAPPVVNSSKSDCSAATLSTTLTPRFLPAAPIDRPPSRTTSATVLEGMRRGPGTAEHRSGTRGPVDCGGRVRDRASPAAAGIHRLRLRRRSAQPPDAGQAAVNVSPVRKSVPVDKS